MQDEKQQHDSEIAALLKSHSTPEASEAFLQRAVARAEREGAKRHRSRWMMTGFASAIAAGLVLWVVGGVFMSTPSVPPSADIPAVVMTVEEPRTVNLVFAATEALPNATLIVSLPVGVELEGFPGRREISWQTSLDEGRNLLPLTLIAESGAEGILLATLNHDDRKRTFRLRVAIG